MLGESGFAWGCVVVSLDPVDEFTFCTLPVFWGKVVTIAPRDFSTCKGEVCWCSLPLPIELFDSSLVAVGKDVIVPVSVSSRVVVWSGNCAPLVCRQIPILG